MVWLINPNHPEGFAPPEGELSANQADERAFAFRVLAVPSPVQASPSMPLPSNALLFRRRSWLRHAFALLSLAFPQLPLAALSVPLLSWRTNANAILCFSSATRLSASPPPFKSFLGRSHAGLLRASALPRYALAFLCRSNPLLRLTPLFISLAHRIIPLPQPLTSVLRVSVASQSLAAALRRFSLLFLG